jgi:hypothetical protein
MTKENKKKLTTTNPFDVKKRKKEGTMRKQAYIPD